MKRQLAILVALSMIIVLSPATTQEVRAEAVCGPMDVAFLIDDTGSMTGALATVQAQAAALIDDIEQTSGGDYQLALVTYKVEIEVDEDLRAGNAAAFQTDVMSLIAEGGPGPNVNVNEAMNTAINSLPAAGRNQYRDFNGQWREGATKVLVIVTDAPPGGFNGVFTRGVDDVQAQQLADTAATMGIKISAVFVPTSGNYAGQKEMMQGWASTTGGLFTQTDSTGAGTGDALRSFIGDCGGPGLCNALASLPALTDDGLLDGLFGWAGLDYVFELSPVTDPDGDPVRLDWVWEDGVAASGQSLIRDFPLTQPLTVDAVDLVVRVVEDVSAHCDVDEVVQTLHHSFKVVPDLGVLLSLIDGLSCDAGKVLASPLPADFIAILCDIKATVNTRGAPPGIVDTVTIHVDETTIASGSGTSFTTRYDALQVADGEHTLSACATAVNDKYARLFCSPGYGYTDLDCTNLPPITRLLGVDGMATGLWGWADLPYTFSASASDPDGDPLDVSWTWADGVTGIGLRPERAFPLGGAVDGLMTVVEDTSRCPFFPGATIDIPVPAFSTLPDLSPVLHTLTAGLSCDVGSIVPSWNEFDIVGVSCPVSGSVDMQGAPVAVLGDLSLRVDGGPIATSSKTTLQHTYRAASVTEGLHELSVCATGENDKYGRLFCSPTFQHYAMDCTNALPKLTGVTSDGFGAGGAGWSGLPYTFNALGVSDPDGDPVVVEWLWEDGTSSIGPSASRWFADGRHGFTVALYEDVSGRCPLAKTAPVFVDADPLSGRAFGFEALPDWTVQLLRPTTGWSCIAGTYVRSIGTGGTDVMSGRCSVSAQADLKTRSNQVIPQGAIRLDGKVLHQGQTSLLSVIYDSLRHSFDEHTIDACYSAKDDKYGRTFCSDRYDYVNIGR